MNGFWTSGWAILFVVFPFLLGAVGLAMSLLLARKASYRRIVGALSGSAWVLQQRHFWGEESFKSRWHQVNMVNGAFLYPAFVIRKGLFDEQEMFDFPTDLLPFGPELICESPRYKRVTTGSLSLSRA
ncbi:MULTISPECIES: hypothetical protein [Pseudomonas]|uniref:hypothetical protein n=1 Tax=Pseudomonas TaxID=286 RepID=UPI001E3C6DC2|nr:MULTISPECIES: hypothetical protein [Pseudomonas]MCE1117401.1 hypothetical protein [Pseudomonas sp. NMI795_08]